jgi:hypothetical protein
MQFSHDPNDNNGARPLDISMQGCTFLLCQVRARLIAARRLFFKAEPMAGE